MADTPLKPADEFDAVRMVVEVLKALKHDEQVRVLRWAQEKVGIVGVPTPGPPGTPPGAPAPTGDIRSFIEGKNPASDVQFAAAVAYYYAFVAPNRAPEINATSLQEATRLANRERLVSPSDTLHNALKRGYLDKGSGKGSFRINTVGENLVAMSLPTSGGAVPRPVRSKAKARRGK
jgi:hypothetical protein